MEGGDRGVGSVGWCGVVWGVWGGVGSVRWCGECAVVWGVCGGVGSVGWFGECEVVWGVWGGVWCGGEDALSLHHIPPLHPWLILDCLSV